MALPASESDAEGDQEDRADPLHHRHGERPHEIGLDENGTPANVDPADQFEAFKKLGKSAVLVRNESPPASA